ncbi:MAG: CoA pyrophosphatase [Pseudomonadota bacterium]
MEVLGPGDEELLARRLREHARRELDLPALPRAAVLVPLVDEEGAWSLVFTQRTDQVDTHQGQVAFPGGHVEPSDAGVVEAALREAHEEVGLPPHQVQVLGLANDAVSITHIHVTPVVGVVHGVFVPVLDDREVARVFRVPLAHLADPASRVETTTRQTPLGELVFPVFSGGPAPIWGLTAWILNELLPLLHKSS